MMLVDILTDGIFAAVAAIGFGAISDPPLRAFPSIALLAAIGHNEVWKCSFFLYHATIPASYQIGRASCRERV